MSTSPQPRSLFRRWVDDAAVFPPGDAPVPQAWSGHLALRAGRYGDLLGPLLVGTSDAASLVDAAAAGPGQRPVDHPVDVGVIARAGTAVEDLLAAVATVRSSPFLQVASVEVAHGGDGRWRSALDPGVPVAVEVPREPSAQRRALDDVAATTDEGATVLAKLRTQATAQSTVPTPQELAAFLLGVRDRDLPFKLTGGLHHAVATTVPGVDRAAPEEQHGALNVLVATHRLGAGAGTEELVDTLASRDAAALATAVRQLDEDEAAGVRARFVSFGCCGVLDPLDGLAGLDLLADPPHTPTKETP